MLSLLSLALLSTPSTAQYDYASDAAVTTAPTATAAAGGDWAQSVTWPAGCELWENPCPAGAMTSGVAPTATAVVWPAGCESWANPCPASAAVASAPASVWSSASDYTNPFTSYTTMTNSNGIITGMPPKATVAGGVSSVLEWQNSAMSGWVSTLNTVVTSEVSSLPSVVPSASYSFVAEASSSATSAPYTGAAVGNRVAGASIAVTLVGIALSLFA